MVSPISTSSFCFPPRLAFRQHVLLCDRLSCLLDHMITFEKDGEGGGLIINIETKFEKDLFNICRPAYKINIYSCLVNVNLLSKLVHLFTDCYTISPLPRIIE
jgi:hypothetical protein